MALSQELISELVKTTNARKNTPTYDNTVYGTIVDDGEQQYAKIDGSEGLTPITTTVELNDGDRVVVTIKNHTATVMGNTTSPAIGTMSANGFTSKIEQTAEKITAIVQGLDSEASAEMTADQIKTTVTNTMLGISSEITQSANTVTSKIVATYIDPINATISGENGLNARLTSAESTITQMPDKIMSTVSGTYLTKSDASATYTTIDVFTTFEQTVEGFSFMGTGGTVKIQLNDLSDEANTAIANATPVYQYSTNGLTNWVTWTDGMDLSSYKYRRESYDGGSTWTGAYQFAGTDGIDGSDGSDASVTYANIKSALERASNAAMTILTGTSIDTVDIYANNIYGGSFYAGTGSDETFACMNGDSFCVYHTAATNPKVMLGAINDGATARLVLGAGNNNLSDTTSRLFIDKSEAIARIHFYDDYSNLCGFSFIRGSSTSGSELLIQGTNITFSGVGDEYDSSIDFSGVDSINWGSHAPVATFG